MDINITKIKKTASGKLVFLDASNTILLGTSDLGQSVSVFSRDEDFIVIHKSLVRFEDGLHINATLITETILDTTVTPFSGTALDLIDILLSDFFRVGADSEADVSTLQSQVAILEAAKDFEVQENRLYEVGEAFQHTDGFNYRTEIEAEAGETPTTDPTKFKRISIPVIDGFGSSSTESSSSANNAKVLNEVWNNPTKHGAADWDTFQTAGVFRGDGSTITNKPNGFSDLSTLLVFRIEGKINQMSIDGNGSQMATRKFNMSETNESWHRYLETDDSSTNTAKTLSSQEIVNRITTSSTTVTDGFSSSSTTEASSANNAKVLNEVWNNPTKHGVADWDTFQTPGIFQGDGSIITNVPLGFGNFSTLQVFRVDNNIIQISINASGKMAQRTFGQATTNEPWLIHPHVEDSLTNSTDVLSSNEVQSRINEIWNNPAKHGTADWDTFQTAGTFQGDGSTITNKPSGFDDSSSLLVYVVDDTITQFAKSTSGNMTQRTFNSGDTNQSWDNYINIEGNIFTFDKQIKITAGNPGVDKVFVSDANGLASWQPHSVATVATETFANKDESYKAELGVPEDLGWAVEDTGSISSLVPSTVFGVVKDVLFIDDGITNDIYKAKQVFDSNDFQNMADFGLSWGGVSRLKDETVNNGFLTIFSSSDTTDPFGARTRWVISFSKNGNYVQCNPNEGDTVILDGNNGVPKVLMGDFFKWEVIFTTSTGSWEQGILYINDLKVDINLGSSSGSGADEDRVVFQTSGGGDNYYSEHSSFGVIIYEESSTKTLATDTMSSDIVQVIVPLGNRDYTIILPDGSPRPIGAELAIITNNIGGKITLANENPSVPEILYNELNKLTLSTITTNEVISGVNIVENSNVYVGFGNIPLETIENLSTGLMEGGQLSINAGDIAIIDTKAGKGRIVDFTNHKRPTLAIIEFPAFSTAGTRLGLTTVTHWLIDLSGSIQQIGDFVIQWPTPSERRDFIYLGNADHTLEQDGFNSANNPQRSAFGLNGGLLGDILESLGGIHGGGDLVTFNGANTQLNIAEGVSLRYGCNMKNSNRPHTADTGTQIAASFVESFMTSSGLSFAPTVTSVTTDKYQPLGNVTTLVDIPAGKYVARKLFRYAGTGANGEGYNVVHHANTAYSSIHSARKSIRSEPFNHDSSLTPSTFLGWLIHKAGETDFEQAVLDGEADYLEWQGAIRPPWFSSNVPLETVDLIFAQLSDLADQTFALVNTPQRILFNSNDSINGITHSTTTRTFDIIPELSGSYTIAAQPQISKIGGGGGTQEYHMWLRKGENQTGTINDVSIASDAVLTFDRLHNLTTGQTIDLENFTTTPDINGEQIVTVLSSTTVSIPVTTTVVTDGIGDFTRLLDANDDISNSNIIVQTDGNSFSTVSILISNEFFLPNTKFNVMSSVDSTSIILDFTPSAAINGEPNVPSIILSITKSGD